MKKKILIFIPDISSGGAERVASVLINHWVKMYDVTLCVFNHDAKEFYQINSDVTRVNLSFNYKDQSIRENISRIKKISSCVKKISPDYVVSFLTGTNIKVCLAKIVIPKDINVILCEHNNYYAFSGKIKRFCRNILYKITSAEITVLTSRDIKNYPSYLHEKLMVLSNPLGVRKPNNITIEKKHEHLKFISVGRLSYQKGFDRLINLMALLKNRNWTLEIYGDGEDKEELALSIIKLGLSNNIFLMGNHPKIEDVYINADLMLMTSRWEGLPMVIPEAMSFALPVIAFDCETGPREFILNGVNGFLVKDDDLNQYIVVLEKVLNSKIDIVSLKRNTLKSSEKYSSINVFKKWDMLFYE